MNHLAIIPARGGSKRIPRKNVKEFLGKPAIAYSIQAALESNLFKEIMVSTDDEEIANIAIQYGAKIPFLRSKENADDYATTFDVIKEVLEKYSEQNMHFDFGCCIYPVAPLVRPSKLKEAFNILLQKKFDTVFPVVAFSNNIYRAFTINEENKAEMIWKENLNKRTQDLPQAYYDAGQFYWFNCNKILAENKIITNNSGVIKLNEIDTQDIDNEADWQLAELKYKLMHGK